MSFVATADFQAEWSNLSECQQAWDEVLAICKKKNVKHICVLGDLKQAMNPVDIRVVKWWQRAIRRAKKLKLTVIIVLGNHDRVGAYSQADNWLSILRRAGAITFDKPGIFNTGDEKLFVLPYCGNEEARESAKKLLTQHPDKKKDVLLFHHDVLGAKYNRQGSESNVSISVDDLNCRAYRLCISGHIHAPQKITDNTYYVGSPFCHDWGEVNYKKRYLVIA